MRFMLKHHQVSKLNALLYNLLYYIKQYLSGELKGLQWRSDWARRGQHTQP